MPAADAGQAQDRRPAADQDPDLPRASPAQSRPTQIVGDHKTVEGGTVKVTGSGDNLKVNGANVICGGVNTANATVYLIDAVLTPKS